MSASCMSSSVSSRSAANSSAFIALSFLPSRHYTGEALGAAHTSAPGFTHRREGLRGFGGGAFSRFGQDDLLWQDAERLGKIAHILCARAFGAHFPCTDGEAGHLHTTILAHLRAQFLLREPPTIAPFFQRLLFQFAHVRPSLRPYYNMHHAKLQLPHNFGTVTP